MWLQWVCIARFRSDHRRPGRCHGVASNWHHTMSAIPFLSIFGRFVRAGPIGWIFGWNPDDSGENRWFPGFSSADLREIATAMHVCAWFLPIFVWCARVRLGGHVTDLDFLKNAWISRFRLIPDHMALIIGWIFGWNPDDSGENRWFPGFSSADLREIATAMHVCAWFLPIFVWCARVRLGGHVTDLDFLKNAWISRFRLIPDHMALIWVRLWQIDQSRTIFDKNGIDFWCVRVIATACSVRHRVLCSKNILILRKFMIFLLQGGEIWYFSYVEIWHGNCLKIYMWPLRDVENPNFASNRRARGWFLSQI